MDKNIFEKLDKCHMAFTIEDQCEVFYVEARELISSRRFDFFSILNYIDQKVKGVEDLSFAIDLYLERTKWITGGTLIEEGYESKAGKERWINDLDNLIHDFQNDSFDIERKLIPIDKNYDPIDGAHRVCCAAYFGKKLKVARFVDKEIHPMDYRRMRHDFVPEYVLDYSALFSCSWFSDIYMLFFWPKSFNNNRALERALKIINDKEDVVYEFDIKLSYKAIRTLMIQIYGHMDWVGSIDDDFQSTYKKADEVWDNNGKIKVLLVRSKSCLEVLNLKTTIRDLFNIGLSSIHSTDNMRETLIAANSLLNHNSRSFLEIASPTRFKNAYKLFQSFKMGLLESNASLNNYIIDTSMILAIYGVRDASDLDYYTLDEEKTLNFASDKIEEHTKDQELFYKTSVKDLILSPVNHFVFNEIKFVSLEHLKEFKINRFEVNHENKDKDDLLLIEATLSNSQNRFQYIQAIISVAFRKRKRIIVGVLRKNIKRILVSLGLYDFDKKRKTRQN